MRSLLSSIPAARRPCRRTGYTLSELLTIVAIIGLALALLIPVFASVRGYASRGSCMSNQRQLAQAIIRFAQDHSRTFPDSSNIWSSDLKFLPRILYCPMQTGSGKGYDYSSFISGQPIANVLNPAQEVVTVDGIDHPMLDDAMSVAASTKIWTESSFVVAAGDQLIFTAAATPAIIILPMPRTRTDSAGIMAMPWGCSTIPEPWCRRCPSAPCWGASGSHRRNCLPRF